MDVILLERIDKLGSIGDVATVRAGYARNYLLPSGKALAANKANRVRFEAEKETIIARNAKAKTDSLGRGEAIDGSIYVVIRQSGDMGRLYGSVSARDIVAAALEKGHEFDRQHVRLDTPIKMIGIHEIAVQLHPEVAVSVKVNVARSQDEAERQAAGENIVEAALADRHASRVVIENDDEADADVEADAAGIAEQEAEEESEEKAGPDADDGAALAAETDAGTG